MEGNGGRKNDVWSSPDGIIWTQVTTSATWSAQAKPATVVYDYKM
jgi:hypothetical protein